MNQYNQYTNGNNNRFKQQKISLTKLAQYNHQIKQLNSNNNNKRIAQQNINNMNYMNNNKNMPIPLQQQLIPKSIQNCHIKFIQQSQPSQSSQQQSQPYPQSLSNIKFSHPLQNISNNISHIKQSKPRRRIFQHQKQSQFQNKLLINQTFQSQQKQNNSHTVKLPTFSKIPENNNVNEANQTKYYSMMMVNVQRQQNHEQNYQTPFRTNKQNEKLSQSNTNNDNIKQNTIILSQLQQKLHKQQQQIKQLKKHIIINNNNNSIVKSKQNSHQNIKQILNRSINELQLQNQQIKTQLYKNNKEGYYVNNVSRSNDNYSQYLQSIQMNDNKLNKSEIYNSKSNISHNYIKINRQQQEQDQYEYEQQMSRIQQQRINRLNRIKLQNQQLYSNIITINNSNYNNLNNNNPSSHYSSNSSSRSYKFPSQQHNLLSLSPFQFSNRSRTSHFPENKLSSLSPNNNQISLIKFDYNKNKSFSLENNTFRDILSPLEIQGSQNNTLDYW